MTKDYSKKLTAVCSALILILLMAACSADPSADGSDIKTINVTLSILYPEEQKTENLEEYTMQVEEDATVMQILESYSDQADIPIWVETSDSPSVTSINGVDTDPDFQWVYEVNGKVLSDEPAADYKPEDGDRIVWKYEKI